ncbi:MAG: pyridoxal phosphate-dependent aminotransferase [Faecousia sp.]
MVSKEMWALGANRSVIRDLFEYGLQQAKIVGPENVFDYSLGNPSIPAPKEVDDAVRAILADTDSVKVHGYTPAIGDFATRDAIARDLNQRYNAGVRAEDLFMSCGAAPSLIAIMRALSATPEAEFVAIAPFFPEYRPFSACSGGKLVVVPADTEHFQINLEALEQRLSPNTQAVIVNSPNNPSGTVYTAETLEALGRVLTRKSREYGHPIYILADEPYRELVYGDVKAPFIPNIYDNTIVCYSYSKSLSLPGERIGYIYVPQKATDSRELYAAIAGAARAGGHVCAPSLWQKVIARCAHLRPDLEAYDRNRKALSEGLAAMGYRMAQPDGAFYLFIQAPGGDDLAFCQRAKEKNLLLVPGTGFDCPGYFRICYCVSPQMIEKSLPVFKELIDTQN